MTKLGKLNWLDTVVVLLASCAFVLFIFFIAGVTLNKPLLTGLPDWLTDTMKGVGSFVGGLTATIVWYVRRQARTGESPNYIAWIFLVTTFLFGGVYAAKSMTNKGSDAVTISVRDKKTGRAIDDGTVTIMLGDAKESEEKISKGSAVFIGITDDRKKLPLSVWIEVPGFEKVQVLNTTYKGGLVFELDSAKVIKPTVTDVTPPRKKLSVNINAIGDKLRLLSDKISIVVSGAEYKVTLGYDEAALDHDPASNKYRYNDGGRLVVKLNDNVIFTSSAKIEMSDSKYVTKSAIETYLAAEVRRIAQLERDRICQEILNHIQ